MLLFSMFSLAGACRVRVERLKGMFEFEEVDGVEGVDEGDSIGVVKAELGGVGSMGNVSFGNVC